MQWQSHTGNKFVRALQLKNHLVISLKKLNTHEAIATLEQTKGMSLSETIQTISDAFPELTNELIERDLLHAKAAKATTVQSLLWAKMDAVEQMEADYARCQTEIARNVLASAIKMYEAEIDRIVEGQDYEKQMNESEKD